MRERDAAVAATRFGLGARPGEIGAAAEAGPRNWLRRQIGAGAPDPGPVPSSQACWRILLRYRAEIARIQNEGGENLDERLAEAQRRLREPTLAHLHARTSAAVHTPASFAERWVRFWSNHFSVSAAGQDAAVLSPTLEAEVIRPNLFGRFEELALGAILHPAMLVYLDNHVSVGPNSPAGRFTGRGLNENLAREALELHTVGSDAGYAQSDVEAFARALTGWTIGREELHPEPQWGLALFDQRLHEPGPQRVMGMVYRDRGADQARAIIRNLARAPATARRISEKVARHFLSDAPGEPQIAHIERAWRRSRGDLAEVARAVVEAPGAFEPGFSKFKPPEAFLISALRALEADPPDAQGLFGAFAAIGQIPFTAPSPEGWPDDEESWADPDAIKKRLEFSNALARRVGDRAMPVDRADAVLGRRLDADTALAVSRAESPVQGFTLFLMSPDFMRR